MMKKLLTIATIALTALAVCSCDKHEDENISEENGYCYSLYTEYQNFNYSDLTVFAPLWDTNDNGEEVTWMRTYYGTRDEADQQAVTAFNQLLGQINDDEACAALHEDDYMTATMQRVEGQPYDLQTKTWRATGVE